MKKSTYLGTDLSPDEYYAHHSEDYSNPHAVAIQAALFEYIGFLHGRIIDLGCGPGLATSILVSLGKTDFVGVDNSSIMVSRYKKETRFPAFQAEFWDELPQADSAVATHSLHLCLPSRLHMVMWRLREANAKNLVVVSPLKGVFEHLPFGNVRGFSAEPDGKTVWASHIRL